MGWLSTAGAAVTIRNTPIVEKRWRLYGSAGWQYSTRTVTTTVYEYWALTEGAATALAATLNYDNTDSSDVGTRSTASAERQNEAGGYKVVRTVQTNTSWSAWR